jgi:signal transduction histidine kinase
MSPLRRSPALRATLIGAAVAITVVAALAIGALSQIRADLTDRGRILTGQVAGLADLPAKPTADQLNKYVASSATPMTVIDATGKVLTRTGSSATWSTTPAGTTTRMAVVGADVTVRDRSVEVTRRLPSGRTVVARSVVPQAAMTISSRRWWTMLGAGILAGLLVGLAVVVAGRRRAKDVAAVTAAAESLIAGRIPQGEVVPVRSDLARAGAAIQQGAHRLEHLSEVADRELGLLAAAIEPLPIGVLGRGPAGGHLRNLALERLSESLSAQDRSSLETALRDGLEATDPVGGRIALSDGRVLEVDAWTVPGGRLVAVTERSEQERLAALRRQLEGAAVRQLRAPIEEIKSRGKELYQHVPAPAAPTLRSILGATDRLDRVVRMMLRGTSHDPAERPPRRETFGIAGFLWGQAHDWDAALRQRALRVELEISDGLPDVRTDSALVQEILTELIDNAAKFTPRGGTIKLGARVERDQLVLDVRDSGAGISAHDTMHATERFFRGQSSESIPGAGLGLGVAAALAERIGGSLEVQAGPGGHVRLLLPIENGARVAA